VHREIEKVLKQLLAPTPILIETPGDDKAAEAAPASRRMPQARLTAPAPRSRAAVRQASRKKA
jgi:hypothetical protein